MNANELKSNCNFFDQILHLRPLFFLLLVLLLVLILLLWLMVVKIHNMH
jgi:hypothetical protein